MNRFPNTPQFLIELIRIIHMLHGMRAENALKLLVFERQVVDVIDKQEIWNIAAVLYDIRIDPAAVRLAAADIEIPSPFVENSFFQQSITQPVEEVYCQCEQG